MGFTASAIENLADCVFTTFTVIVYSTFSNRT